VRQHQSGHLPDAKSEEVAASRLDLAPMTHRKPFSPGNVFVSGVLRRTEPAAMTNSEIVVTTNCGQLRQRKVIVRGGGPFRPTEYRFSINGDQCGKLLTTRCFSPSVGGRVPDEIIRAALHTYLRRR